MWSFLFLHNVDVISVEKILENLEITKVSGMDQISARFLKVGAPVITIDLVILYVLRPGGIRF